MSMTVKEFGYFLDEIAGDGMARAVAAGMEAGLQESLEALEAGAPVVTGNFRRALGVNQLIPASTVPEEWIEGLRNFEVQVRGAEVTGVLADGMSYASKVEDKYGLFQDEFGGQRSPGAQSLQRHIEEAYLEYLQRSMSGDGE